MSLDAFAPTPLFVSDERSGWAGLQDRRVDYPIALTMVAAILAALEHGVMKRPAHVTNRG